MNLVIQDKKLHSPVPPSFNQENGAAEFFYPETDGKPVAETELHINTIFDLYSALRRFFAEKSGFRVFSDIMFYYAEGEPEKAVAPDLMVVKSDNQNLRRVFKLWEENAPEVVFEISSRGTWREDLQKKYFLYQSIGVKEYYIFDPEYDYLKDEFFVANHLINDEFQEVKLEQGRIFSPALNLELVNTGETLRLYDPATKAFLPTDAELADENNLLIFEAAEKDKEIENLKKELAKLKRQN